MRDFDLVARAFGPRRSHSISVCTRFSSASWRFALRVEILFLGFQELAVVSIDAQESVFIGAVELDHVISDILEKVAVVADDYAGERSVLQQRLEPFNSGEIEMVGGLVQQQNIRLLDQRFGNCQALFPSAGERGGGNFRSLQIRRG